MNSKYINRSIESTLKKAFSEFPAVVLTGPRQAGKTTVLKRLFGGQCNYVSLETPDMRAAATGDPRGFLRLNPPPVIIDEAQHCPDLLSYIKEMIDARRHQAGQFLLTGSQNLLLSEKISESLAGRAAILRLLPLSRRESEARPDLPLAWDREIGPRSSSSALLGDTWTFLIRGGYPELHAQPDREFNLWHNSYLQTYLERDVRTIRQIGDLVEYQSFLRSLAARSGQLLNLTDIARDLGVAVNTIKSWLSVLEATYQVVVVRPYFANIGKRLVKMPKVYFTDTGMLCHLVGLRDPVHAAAGPMGGAILETAVLSEIMKALTHKGITPLVYFWRTQAGTEVDFITETGPELIPVEVKLSATPRSSMASSLKVFLNDFKGFANRGFVVHSGDTVLPLGPGVTALPFNQL